MTEEVVSWCRRGLIVWTIDWVAAPGNHSGWVPSLSSELAITCKPWSIMLAVTTFALQANTMTLTKPEYSHWLM